MLYCTGCWKWECRDEAGKYKTSLTFGDSRTREFVPHCEPVGFRGRPLVQLGPHKHQDKKPELNLTRRRQYEAREHSYWYLSIPTPTGPNMAQKRPAQTQKCARMEAKEETEVKTRYLHVDR